MSHDAPEHIIKVLPWIDPAGLTGLYQPEEESSGPCASVTGCEQPVLPSQSQGSDGVFSRVIVGFQASVIKVTVKDCALVQAIVNGFTKRFRR